MTLSNVLTTVMTILRVYMVGFDKFKVFKLYYLKNHILGKIDVADFKNVIRTSLNP